MSRDYSIQQEVMRLQRIDNARMASSRAAFIKAAEIAASKNTHISHDTFRGIIAAYDADYSVYHQALDDAKLNARTPNEKTALERQAHIDHQQRLNTALAAIPNSRPAVSAMHAEMQDKSILHPFITPVYDNERDGMQFAGLAGGAAGAGLGYYLTRGSGWLVTTLASVAGFFLGAKLSDMAFGAKKPTLSVPDFHTPATAVATPPVVAPVTPVVNTPPQPVVPPQNNGPVPPADIQASGAPVMITPAALTGRESTGFEAPAPQVATGTPQPGNGVT